MITLQLNTDEHQVLIDVLERELPNLRHEIHHTDDHDYREFLKAREHLLERVLGKVKVSAPGATTGDGETEKSGYAS